MILLPCFCCQVPFTTKSYLYYRLPYLVTNCTIIIELEINNDNHVYDCYCYDESVAFKYAHA